MGNIGGIEKIMVFGILIIIVAILGIAFYSAIKVEDDIVPSRLKASGEGDAVKNYRTDDSEEESLNNSSGSGLSVAKDVANSESIKANVPIEENGSSPADQKETVILSPTPNDDVTDKKKTTDKKPAKTTSKYKIKKGDSFMKIARTLYGDEKKYLDIIKVNPDVDPNRLQLGQKINLPEAVDLKTGQPVSTTKKKNTKKTPAVLGKTHTVSNGDTLVGISKQYYGDGRKWRKIWDANRQAIIDPDTLKIGTTLIIP